MGANVFVLILLHVCILPVFAQRWQRQGVQRCYTPDNLIGVCVTLSNCPSVANLYAANRNSPDIVPYLMALKRNCGNRVYRNDPVVCCIEAYTNQPRITTQPPVTRGPVTRLPPVRVSTAPPVITTAPPPPPPPTPFPNVPSTPEPRLNTNCRGPDFTPGTCKDIKQCPLLLNRLSASSQDAVFVQFLRQSNQICDRTYGYVCCPNGDASDEVNLSTFSPPIDDSNGQSFINRLPTIADGCGLSNNTFRKIVGGNTAKLGAWPWIALLGYGETGGVDFKCGGALITQRHVLTAAHCIRNDLVVVRLGEHDLKTNTETQHIDVPVAKFERHPTYTRRDGYADIAIVYLDRTVQFTELIKPVCLPQIPTLRSKSYVDHSPFVVGWGKTQEGGQSATVLQELQIPVYNNTVCINAYNDQGKYISVRQFDESILCAGFLLGGKDTCQGDSGGPLMIPEKINDNFHFFELGVVSYGIGCARPKIPGVYTSVQYYMDWIEQKVSETN